MKTPSVGSVVRHLFLLALLLNFNAQLSTAFAQGIGTAFTYQGRLNASGQPANGLYDLRFRLATDALGFHVELPFTPSRIWNLLQGR